MKTLAMLIKTPSRKVLKSANLEYTMPLAVRERYNVNLIVSGKGGELVDRGDNTYGGKWVVNPSGGLISKGHPLGATGNL